MLKDLVLGDDMLTLSINEGAATGFDYFWLRDNAVSNTHLRAHETDS